MIFRGIQIVGLLVAVSALAFIFYARRKGRLNGRFFLFWVLFWGIFVVLDVYPSLAAYFAPLLDLGSNMFVLTAGSVLTLFVLVFGLYSFLSDLNRKVNTLVRSHAILDSKLSRLLVSSERGNDGAEDSGNNSGS